MRTISHILPDEHCAQLLNMPSLMQFSSLTRASNTNIRAHKASEMLEVLADAFTVAPRDYRCSQHLPRYCNVTPVTYTQGFKAYHNKQGGPAPEEESRNYYHQFAKVGILGFGIGKSQVISICSMADHMTPLEGRKRGKLTLYAPTEAMKTQGHMSMRSDRSLQFGLGNEITQSIMAKTHIVAAGDTADGTEKAAGEATELQLQDIRKMRSASAATPADYVRLLDATKVNGKEGKEPFKWNWESIIDLLVHEFNDINAAEAKGRRTSLTNTLFSAAKSTANPNLSNSGILAEAMKSKWVRRMCGFYRCSTEQKGYFANLTWEPSNLNYLECAVLLHQRLVDDVNGQAFLRGDRRGMLYNEIASEIKTLLTAFDRSRPTASFFSMNRSDAGPVLNASSHVFRRHAMQGTLSREYFTLLGNVLLKAGGQTIVDESEIFQHLSRSGHIPELDYFSRVAITSLVFTDRGFMSQHLIDSWTSTTTENVQTSIGASRGRKGTTSTPKAESTGRQRTASALSTIPVVGKSTGLCSVGLQNYIFNLLGVLLYARPAEFRQWGIDTVVSFLDKQVVGQVPLHLIRLLLQIVQRVENLAILIDKLNERTRADGRLSIDMTVDTAYKPVLLYFLTVPQGLQYLRKGRGHPLNEGSYLAQLLENASKEGGDAEKYVREFELLMAKAVSPAYLKCVISPSAHIKPIPYFTKNLSDAYSNEGDSAADMNAAQQRKMSETAANAAAQGGDGRASMYGPGSARASTSEATAPNGSTPFSGIYDFGSKSSESSHPQPHVSSDVRATAAVELEGLLKLPWSIEVKSFAPKESIYSENKSISIPTGCPGGEYIGLDTYADTSDLVMPATSEITADKNRFIKIRGFVLDEKGMPGGRAIKEGKVLGSALMLGACPVSKKGEVTPAVQGGSTMISFEQARRNTANNLSVPPMRRASLGIEQPVSPTAVPSHLDDLDTPPTYMLETLYDWTVCNPINSGVGNAVYADLSEAHFSVEIPGEPCKYIFSREKVITSYAADAVGGPAVPQKRSSLVNSLITGVSNLPGLGGISRKSIIETSSQQQPPPEQPYERSDERLVYLLEVQYYISIKTGQSPFAVIPPHPYGMLVRSHEGSALLASKGIIRNLITTVQADTALPLSPPFAFSEDAAPAFPPVGGASSAPVQSNNVNNTRRLKAALWALGHIASSDSGFEAITIEARKIHEASKETAFIQRKAFQLSQSQSATQLLNESTGYDSQLPRAVSEQEEGAATEGILKGTDKLHRSKSSDSISSIDGEAPHESGFRPPLPPSISSGNFSRISPLPHPDVAFEPPSRDSRFASRADSPSEFSQFHAQPAFPLVEWCVRMVREHPSYSVRATVFSVLGLISRSDRGKILLGKYDWESASHGSNSAVSVPKFASMLFARSAVEDELYAREALAQPVPERMRQIAAFLPHYSSPDLQVLQLIAKLNGSPGSNSLARLQHMTQEKPEVFESRELFVNVMHMFETYTFSLKDRRDIVALFSDKAKRRKGCSAAGSEEKK